MKRSLRGRVVPGDPAPARFDGTNLISVYLVLLFLVPANLTVHALGAAGSPAGIYGIGLFVTWVVARIRYAVPRDHAAIRWAFAVMVGAYLASYAVMSTRPAVAAELSNADRGLLRLLGWAGVLLVAMDGIRTRAAMKRIMEITALCGAIVGLVGLSQYLLKFDPVVYIHIPGLSANSVNDLTEIRSGFSRAAGTASHPIEYSVVMAIMLAAAIPLATRRGMPTNWRRLWIAVATITIVAVPLAVARSGFVALAVLLAIMVPSWPKAWRRRFYVGLPFGLIAGRLAFPGLLGTIRSLFTSTFNGTDNSTKGRTQDYSAVAAYFHDRPWLGRGFSTFLPSTYRTLDNQYLGTLIETGIIGLTATFALFIVAIRAARQGRRCTTDRDDRLLGQALVAWVAAAWACAATFDGFGFPMFTGMLFLGIGLCGAYRGIVDPVPTGETLPAGRPVRPVFRVSAAVVTLLGTAVVGYAAKSTPPVWTSVASLTINSPPLTASSNLYGQPVQTERMAELLYLAIADGQTRRQLRAAGATARYEVSRGAGSLQMGTDVYGDGPVLHFLVQSPSAFATGHTMTAVLARLNQMMTSLQDGVGVPQSSRARITDLQVLPDPVPLIGSHRRGYIAIAVIAFGVWIAFGRFLQALSTRRRREWPATVDSRAAPVPVG